MDRDATDQTRARPKRSRSGHVPLGIYGLIAGLVLLFVISAFAFGDTGYADYLLAIVALGIPYLSWVTWRHHTDPAEADAGSSLRDWSNGECETWQCTLKGRDAIVQILLPIGAVAVGMMAIGTVLLLVESHLV